MSKNNWRMGLLLASAASCALVAVGSAAATPASSDVSIVLTQDAATYDTIGWSATGSVLSGEGTWAKGLIRFHGGTGTAIFAGTIQTTMTNRAGTGSFRMNFQGLGNGATGVFSGTWQIGSGTGVYAGPHGTGTWFEDDSNPGLFVFPCQGRIHVD